MMRYRKGDNERSSLFTRRAFLLGGAQVALMSALVGRLYQLQVIETQRFSSSQNVNGCLSQALLVGFLCEGADDIHWFHRRSILA